MARALRSEDKEGIPAGGFQRDSHGSSPCHLRKNQGIFVRSHGRRGGVALDFISKTAKPEAAAMLRALVLLAALAPAAASAQSLRTED